MKTKMPLAKSIQVDNDQWRVFVRQCRLHDVKIRVGIYQAINLWIKSRKPKES